MKSVDVVVIGAGPTGLGAATRLSQFPDDAPDFKVFESSKDVGGLSKTLETTEGFLFDLGGHVIFSHYEYFDSLLKDAVGDYSDESIWKTHKRASYVRYKERWVPYPFQNNLSCVPREDQIACIHGLMDELANATMKPSNFDEWIVRKMGSGLANIFMRPYNFKVWGCPPSMMQCEWLGERVSMVDPKTVVSNVINNVVEDEWGPNAIFRFPAHGGTGSIWKRVAAKCVDRSKIELNTSVVRIDLDSRELVTRRSDDGKETTTKFKRALCTAPLDLVLRDLIVAPYGGQSKEQLVEWANALRHTSTHVVGIGFRGESPHADKCWTYFPESNCDFYRATV